MARKVNTQFLVILLSVVGALVLGAGGLIYYRHRHHDPKQIIAIAQKAEQSGNYAQAAQNYIGAAQLLHDADLMVKAGDMYNQAVYDDGDNLSRALQCWDLAVTTKPDCLPALQRQLNFWKAINQLHHEAPSPRLYDNIKSISQKILKIDPKNLEAREAAPIAAIDAWIHHFENDQTQIDAAVKQLVDIQPEDPNNAKIPFYIAAAYATESTYADRDGKPADAAKLHDQAINTIQQALKDHDSDAAFHFYASQIYLSEPVTATDTAKIEAKRNRFWMELRKASTMAKPEDPNYDEIKITAATYGSDSAAGDSIRIMRMFLAAAVGADVFESVTPEKIYRDVLKQRPTDLAIRNKLADLLGGNPDTRDEAIDLLKTLPDPIAEDRVGPRGAMIKDLELECLTTLTNLRLDKVLALTNKSEQEVLMPQIQADFRKLNAKAPDSPLVLRIKAKLELAQGNVTEAIATLDPAIAKTNERDPMHFELMFLAARCYLQTNQSGSAKKYLQQIVNNYPSYEPARILLAQTQLREFDYDGANENISALQQSDPDNFEVVRMRIAVLLQQKKTDDAKKIYDKLPEQTRGQQLGKATVAILLNMPDENKRLLDTVLSANPGDVQAALMLSGYYTHAKDTPNALAVLDQALKAKPDNTDLLIERARLAGSSPEQMQQIRLQEAQKITDPLERELALMDLTRDEPDGNVPLQHLQAAEKINPKDQRVLTALFEYNLGRKNWDDAKTYADRLAQINGDKVGGTLYYWRLALTQAQAEQDSQKRTDLLAKALDLATQLTHDYPEFAQTWLCMGQTLATLGRYEDAIPNFANAKEKQPQNADAYEGLVDCYYRLNRPDDAGKVIKDAVAALPGAEAFKEMQVRHEMEYGDPEKVVANREQAVKDQPDSPQALMELAQVYAKVADSKESHPQTQGQADAWREKSKAALAQGADKFPDYLDFTINYGVMCQALNQPDEGEKLWKTVLSKAPWKDKPVAIANFSDYYLRVKRPDDAEKLLRDYLASAGKGDVDMTLRLVDLLASQNKPGEALKVADSMPDNSQLQLRKVDLLISQNKLNEAESVIQDQLKKQKTPPLTAALAYVYLNSNRAPQAMDLLNALLTDNPAMTNARYYRAMAALKLPNPKLQDVVNDLSRVRDESPQNLAARYILADCDVRMNNVDDATRELEQILRISPGQKTARMKLMDLYGNASPPRWLDAQRIAREGEAQPDLANDADFLAAEAQMYSRNADTDHAIRSITQAMKIVPNNPTLIRIYYSVLISGNMGQQLISDSDQLPKELKDAWWVHSMRGAAKCKMGDKDAGIAEFVNAVNLAFASKDDAAAQLIIDDMAKYAGADRALKAVSKLPQASEPRWLFTIAWLQAKNKDVATARTTLEQLLSNMDKLSSEQQAMVLDFGGSLYLQTPDPNFTRSRDLYLQLLKFRPNSYEIYNNLACNSAVSAADALDYGRKAYDLMQQSHQFQPLVADTYGWNLVQTGDSRNIDMGINVLLDAWKAKEIPDTAYHLAKAYIAQGNAIEAQKYLDRAQELYSDALKNDQVFDVTLQQSILDAQSQVKKLKGNRGS